MKKLLGILVLGLLFFVQIPFIANAAKSSSIMDGSYQLTWGKKNVFLKKKTSKVWPHIVDFITIKDGKIKFDLLDAIVIRKDEINKIPKKYRKKLKLKVSENKFIITGILDMDSDGAKRVKIKGSSKPDEYGVFVGEVLWDQNKKKAKKSFIHVELTPIPEGSDGKIKEKEKIIFASSSPTWYVDLFDGIDNDQPQESFGYLEFPFFHNEKKPIPLMIMVHSSSGKKIHRKWHVFMHKLGVATFEPRVFEPRKSERNIYLKGGKWITEAMGTADALRALDVLAADPRIDAKKIGIMGWSYGGTVAVATKIFVKDIISKNKFALHVAYYPWCYLHKKPPTSDAPLLIFSGGKDMVTPAQLCKEYVQDLNNLGHSNAEFVYYPDAYHSFEKGADKEYDQYTTSVTKDCRLHILENGHEVFQLGKDKEYDVTAAGGWFEIKGEKKGEADVVDACFRPGANQGGGVEEGKDALSRLKEKIKKHLLN